MTAGSQAQNSSFSDEAPWRSLPPEVAPTLRPLLPSLADEMIAEVRRLPAYSRPMEGEFGAAVRSGVESALAHLLDEAEAGAPVQRENVYERLGRGEMRSGRTLESLLAAYRVGARVAWRRFNAAGIAAGFEAATLGHLAESIFAYIDVLSSESAAGHAAEQSVVVDEISLRRRRLVRLLVRTPPSDPEALQMAAASAAWKLPRSLAVLALDGPGSERVMRELGGEALAETIGEVLCVLVPDPQRPGRRADLERAVAVGRLRAGLGTTGPSADAALSFTRASAALALASPGELVGARERAGELLLRSDPGLADALSEDRLAPLAGLTSGGRARLLETLEAWLEEQGRVGAVAARLGIHVQTARYRVARLRDLFGQALEDPDERFWIQAALRAQEAQAAPEARGAAQEARGPAGEARGAAREGRGAAREGQAAAGGAGSGSGAGSGVSGTSGPSSPAAISSLQK